MLRGSGKKASEMKGHTSLKRTVWICALGGICVSGGGTMVFPFLSFYLLELGATPENVELWTSLASSSTFLMGAIVLPIWGALSDRMGQKKMILRASASLALAFFMAAAVTTPLQFIGVRMFQGFSFGYFPICQSLLSSLAGNHAAEAISVLMAGRSAGSVLGPFLGGTFAHFFGMRTSFLVGGAGYVLSFLLILFFIKEPPKKQETKRVGIAESFHILSKNKLFVRIMSLMVVNQAATILINPIFSLYVAELTGDMADADLISGIIVGIVGISGVIAAPFWGKLCTRRGVDQGVFWAFAGSAVTFFMQWAAPNIWLFALGQLLFGIFVVGGTIALTAGVNECTDGTMRGSAFGLLATSMNVGNFIGPLLGGVCADIFGLASAFFLGGLILLAATFWIWHRLRTRAAA